MADMAKWTRRCACGKRIQKWFARCEKCAGPPLFTPSPKWLDEAGKAAVARAERAEAEVERLRALLEGKP